MASDLRVEKTLQAIKNGFGEAILEKPFSKLTIQDLTEKMLINKSTFYKYYCDKYDLRDQLIQQTLRLVENSIDISYLHKDDNNLSKYQEVLPQALEPLLAMRSWLHILWSPNMESNFFEQMEQAFIQKFENSLLSNEKKRTETYSKLHARIFAASAMQVIKWWLEDSPDTAVDQVARIITKCLSEGTYTTFQNYQ